LKIVVVSGVVSCSKRTPALSTPFPGDPPTISAKSPSHGLLFVPEVYVEVDEIIAELV
jgi:hypothetical protein